MRNPSLLEKYGFNPYVNKDEEANDSEVIIAKPHILPADCGIVKHLKHLFEASHRFWLKDNTRTEEEMHDYDDYQFNEDGTVVMTPEIEKEWIGCQIGFYANGDVIGKSELFINDALQNQYYNVVVLNEAAKEVIDELLKDGVIYIAKVKNPEKTKVRTKKDKAKRKAAKQARKKSRKK